MSSEEIFWHPVVMDFGFTMQIIQLTKLLRSKKDTLQIIFFIADMDIDKSEFLLDPGTITPFELG